MIIISNKPGQLCNLIIIYANFIAFAREHGMKVKNPAFYEYKKYFRGTRKSGANKFSYAVCNFFARACRRANIHTRLVSNVYLDNNEHLDLDAPHALKKFSSAICFVQGWKYVGNNLMKKYKEELKEIFKPSDEYLQVIKSYFQNPVFSSDVLVIGLHVRRGDYARFEGGKYFYDVKTYQSLMDKTAALFDKKKIVFVICSNEKRIQEQFRENNYVLLAGPGTEITDLYTLAQCNYLIGPPSTYTMWASYYSDIPLCMVKDPEMEISVSQFKVLDHF